MHITKVKISGGDYSRLADHMERNHDHYKNYVDTEKSNQNIELIPYLTEEEMQKKAIAETGKKFRSDAVGSINIVVTCPSDEPLDFTEDYFGGSSSYEDWSRDMISSTLKALNLKESDVIGATLHMDETNPHLHFSVMPLAETENGYKLCAKEITRKEQLDKLHDRVQAEMRNKGYIGTYVKENVEERGLGKKSLEEYKKSQELVNELKTERAKINKEINSLYAQVNSLNHDKRNIENWLKNLDNNIQKTRSTAQEMLEACNCGLTAESKAITQLTEEMLKGLEKVAETAVYGSIDILGMGFAEYNRRTIERAKELKAKRKDITEKIKQHQNKGYER